MPQPVAKTDSVALLITKHVGRGLVTTCTDISQSVYGHNRRAKAIVTMMKAWAAKDARNWTHRVVNEDGTLVDAALQRARLEKEGVAFDDEDRVLLDKHRAELPRFKSET